MFWLLFNRITSLITFFSRFTHTFCELMYYLLTKVCNGIIIFKSCFRTYNQFLNNKMPLVCKVSTSLTIFLIQLQNCLALLHIIKLLTHSINRKAWKMVTLIKIQQIHRLDIEWRRLIFLLLSNIHELLLHSALEIYGRRYLMSFMIHIPARYNHRVNVHIICNKLFTSTASSNHSLFKIHINIAILPDMRLWNKNINVNWKNSSDIISSHLIPILIA